MSNVAATLTTLFTTQASRESGMFISYKTLEGLLRGFISVSTIMHQLLAGGALVIFLWTKATEKEMRTKPLLNLQMGFYYITLLVACVSSSLLYAQIHPAIALSVLAATLFTVVPNLLIEIRKLAHVLPSNNEPSIWKWRIFGLLVRHLILVPVLVTDTFPPAIRCATLGFMLCIEALNIYTSLLVKQKRLVTLESSLDEFPIE